MEPGPPVRRQRGLGLRRAHADRAGPAGSRLSPTRRLSAALAVCACLAGGALAGCGGPAELSGDQARTLSSARERLDDALETHEICRTDKAECRRLVREVRRYAGRPSRLEALVPSVVSPAGNVYPPAYRAFVQLAVAAPRDALRLPAAKEVERMVSTLEGGDPETRIATLENQTADAYLAEAQRDTSSIWPDLAKVLGQAREEL